MRHPEVRERQTREITSLEKKSIWRYQIPIGSITSRKGTCQSDIRVHRELVRRRFGAHKSRSGAEPCSPPLQPLVPSSSATSRTCNPSPLIQRNPPQASFRRHLRATNHFVTLTKGNTRSPLIYRLQMRVATPTRILSHRSRSGGSVMLR